jgi:hypothetical protein
MTSSSRKTFFRASEGTVASELEGTLTTFEKINQCPATVVMNPVCADVEFRFSVAANCLVMDPNGLSVNPDCLWKRRDHIQVWIIRLVKQQPPISQEYMPKSIRALSAITTRS